jgi:enterochelin esterase-like enzyme
MAQLYNVPRMTNSRAVAALVLATLTVVWSAAAATAQPRTARTLRFDSAALGAQATVAVLLPPGYDASDRRYPVVYLLHGGTQNHAAFPARSWFVREASRHSMIVVMPHIQPVYFSGRAGAPPAFEAFIAKDLVGHVDANYRTIASRSGRAIAGISMGGFGAAIVGLKHHDAFGTVGPVSAAFTGGARQQELETLVAALPADAAPYFYIACGAQDSLVAGNRRFAELLAARSIAHEYQEVPGDHSWTVWDPQVQAFMTVLAKQPGWTSIP